MARRKKPEQGRFVDIYRIYLENSRGVALITGQSTSSASASKTMSTRKQLNGPTAMSDSGVQSVKDSGKQKTQSQ